MSDSMSQYCPNCEAQAGEIVGLKAQLHMVLDREADTHCRHDAKVEALEAEINELRAVVDALLQHEASSFFGPDEGKHQRASWRGVIRKAKKARAGKAEQ